MASVALRGVITARGAEESAVGTRGKVKRTDTISRKEGIESEGDGAHKIDLKAPSLARTIM